MAPQLRRLPHRRHYRGQHLSIDSSTSRAPKMARKDAISDSADRLSDLPDPLLCHILSFVDTKYAVATSVLSTRWKHLYISIPNIILDDSLTRKTKNEKSVVDFAIFGMRQILLRNVPHINQFRLKCNFSFKHQAMKSLVCFTIWRDVAEVDIRMARDVSIVSLPPEVFTSRSLVVLKLTVDHHKALPLVVPDYVSLPNLKVLHLGTLKLHDSVNRLFEGCKLLEDLCLSSCIYEVHKLVFSFPFLRKLSIINGDAWDGMSSTHDVVIDASNLELFEYQANLAIFLRMKKPMSNGRAEFDIQPLGDIQEQNLLEFIEELRGIKSLYLSEGALEAMLYPLAVPSFKAPASETLTRLELDSSAINVLPNILEYAPKLEVLVINQDCEDDQDTIWDFELREEIVPICLTQHLRTIEFSFYVSSERLLERDLKTMKYFLQNGKVLERMEIYVNYRRLYYREPPSTRNTFFRSAREKLKMLRGFSKTCEVVIEY